MGAADSGVAAVSSRKSRGTRRELAAIASLEKLGYTVLRSTRSEGPADFVAFGANNIKVVQVKSRAKGGIYPGEIQAVKEEMADLPRLPGVSYECWCYRKVGYYWRLSVMEA